MVLVPPYIESPVPYEAGRSIEEIRRQYGFSRVAKLASNENPFGSSPLAVEAAMQNDSLAKALPARTV